MITPVVRVAKQQKLSPPVEQKARSGPTLGGVLHASLVGSCLFFGGMTGAAALAPPLGGRRELGDGALGTCPPCPTPPVEAWFRQPDAPNTLYVGRSFADSWSFSLQLKHFHGWVSRILGHCPVEPYAGALQWSDFGPWDEFQFIHGAVGHVGPDANQTVIQCMVEQLSVSQETPLLGDGQSQGDTCSCPEQPTTLWVRSPGDPQTLYVYMAYARRSGASWTYNLFYDTADLILSDCNAAPWPSTLQWSPWGPWDFSRFFYGGVGHLGPHPDQELIDCMARAVNTVADHQSRKTKRAWLIVGGVLLGAGSAVVAVCATSAAMMACSEYWRRPRPLAAEAHALLEGP